MWEGMFKDGNLVTPHIYLSRQGTVARLKYPDGRVYDVHHQVSREYGDEFTILQYKKGVRHAGEGVTHKEFRLEDK